MVLHRIIFFILTSISWPILAQDERYFRQIFSGDLPKIGEKSLPLNEPLMTVRGSGYRVDLNGDGLEEIIEPQKRDGVDWIEIKNSSHHKIFEAKLFAMGGASVLYKIRLVDLSPRVRALILFLDEGVTKGKRFESTARFYVISFEDNNLTKMTLAQGPHFFHEKEGQRDMYWRRDYNVNIYDIDNDGLKEIAVQYNRIQRIMKYKGLGEWERF
jgi:hypothetical protein